MWYEEISQYLVSRGRAFADEKWVKRAMKHSFLGYEDVESVDVVTGEITVTQELKHTSKLTTGDMHHYLSKVESWAQSIGCLLTVPDNCEYRELQRKQEE